jgi:hypothetical protein
MKALNSMICWNPGTGQVAVVPHPDHARLSQGFQMTTGACDSNWPKTKSALRTAMFIEAAHLIVRDRCDPQAVHSAFLVVDEYRHGCAFDMPGMKGQDQ